MSKPILLFSGGLDSFITWRLLGRPRCVYVCLGHHYQRQELDTVRRLLECLPIELEVTEVGQRFGTLEQPDGHIPYRNLVLALVGATYGSPVWLGALRGETSRDKSHRFYREVSRLLGFLEPGPARVEAPVSGRTKTGLVAEYLRRFPTPEDRWLLLQTRSCYEAGELPCGRCMACVRRWVALRLNDLHETYQVDPGQVLAAWMRENPMRPLRYFLRCPPREWPGVLQSNFEAVRALRAGSGG